MLYQLSNREHWTGLSPARLFSGCLTLLFVALTIQSPLPAEAAVQEYTISAEDVLEVSVWKEADLQREVVVRPDGGITFPLVGEMEAAGKTPRQLELDITQRLEAYIPDAVVTVSVIQLRGLRIYVTGKVRSPGQYEVGRYIDILQAITLAGGLTPFADDSDIRVLRREDGRETVFKFNYGQVEKGKNLEQNIVLQADDIVVVP
jgi:polysaccharide export outer membrane protein